ncbi:MAG: tRNA-intron lyase [bacterium]|nr:tRNA-intron lyase [bacterium]
MEKKPKDIISEPEIQEKISAEYCDGKVLAEATNASRDFYEKSRYGEPFQKKFQYSLVEALYLVERGKMQVMQGKKELSFDQLLKIAGKAEANFFVRYATFKDMRNRGYIVKTALKFGADFRVYDRGVKPGDDHAKWIMYPISESDVCSWYEFSAKNRVAHSTRKRLLIGIVDEESDVTYYEIKWTRP